MHVPGSRPADLRVLVVTPDFPPQGGGIQLLLERVVRNAPSLDVRVLTLGHPEAAEFDQRTEIDVRRVSSVEAERRLAALRLNAASLAEARRFRPDVILSGHVVVSLGAILLRRALRIPLVQYVHADELRGRSKVGAVAVRHADATIAVSGYTRDLVVAAGSEPARVHVIHPGVDLPDKPVAARDQTPTLLTVASLLFRYKGHDVMVKALSEIRTRVPNARWVVIGDGPLRPEIEAAVDLAGLDEAVEFLGRTADAERNRWLDRAWAFCMPSRIPGAGIGGEGFGIAYMEAAAHRLPTIGGNVAGALDAVVDRETGLLVDPTDHLAVAAAAVELLSDRERAEAMGRAGRRYAEEHAWPRIAAQVEGLLREVADKGVV
jgi:phosphatidyl-myo-inositol dimannoside synthase